MRRRTSHRAESGSSILAPRNQKGQIDSVILRALAATQVSLLLVLSFVILLSLNGDGNNLSAQTLTTGVTYKARESLRNSIAPLSLAELLEVVVKAFESDHITYWLLPGLNLLPPSNEDGDGRVIGKLTPWHEGVDLGIFQDDLMKVIQVQTLLQSQGIIAVESYFGLRMFLESGYEDTRYDFRRPFIDVVYFREEEDHVVSHCCDCVPNSVGACSKKTCDCMVCLAKTDDVFPLATTQIEGVQCALKAPRRLETLMLRDTSNSVHPSLRKLLAHVS
ncbi:hypothetical protein FGB62_4g331 [Gracilaria domingensis]|nr:hypothetical protein FGB62_4g331 [Gracilaria domingensis]